MPETSTSPWVAVGTAVDEDGLHLDRGAAQQCSRHCSELLHQLVQIRERARSLGDLKGLGTLPSGVALAAKFSRKAVGGPNSMVDVLTAHIAEVEAMREVFVKIEARYLAAEQRSVDGFAAIPQ